MRFCPTLKGSMAAIRIFRFPPLRRKNWIALKGAQLVGLGVSSTPICFAILFSSFFLLHQVMYYDFVILISYFSYGGPVLEWRGPPKK